MGNLYLKKNKIHLFKVYSFMNFDKYVYLCSHHRKQVIEHFHHYKFPYAPLQSILSIHLQPLATTDLFSVTIVLSFQNIIQIGLHSM